jgi:hypothetical protein
LNVDSGFVVNDEEEEEEKSHFLIVASYIRQKEKNYQMI